MFGLYNVAWIDAGLTATPDFINRLFMMLNNEDLRVDACLCLNEVVIKGMQPPDKVALLENLRIPTVFSSIQPVVEHFDFSSIQPLLG